ncbi:MAG: phosphonate ABC transporter, permease protein PhnE [Candidatus Bipolaricaulota bacterium]|nr:phosphonate ABC transporter, permease protein PhnE [Candidatus Bipolaricaulota bacterium]MCX7843964.1 phosphonate ABC transporter, permease protein PhnE [Candidatus Bipolaricaulota bacterium]MDW8151719.1 phosphonate ABC transporter, permease protein PhnE [Candidatus Bipolaricaulota bacterium]
MKLLRARALAFLLDLLVWAYLLYSGFTLYYLSALWSPWRPEEKLVWPALSPWAWAVVLVGLGEAVLLTQAFGPSLGQRLMGVHLVAEDGAPPKLAARLAYFGFSHLALATLGLGSVLHPQRPWHERWAGVRLEPLPPPSSAVRRPPWYRTAYGLTALLVALATLAVGWRLTEVDLRRLVYDASKSLRIWYGLIGPDFRYLLAPDPRIKLSLVDGLVQSLYMALLATVAGTVAAFPLSFLGARNVAARHPVGWAIYALTRGFFNVVRSVETVFWAAIFAIWLGWGPFAGATALFVHTVAALGKLFSEQVEHIDPGPVEAVTATGANLLQVVRYAVVPQVLPQYLAFAIYRWDINLRMAVVVALVGGGGIGRHLFEYKDDLRWSLVGAVILLFMLTVWVMDYLSGWIREKIV